MAVKVETELKDILEKIDGKIDKLAENVDRKIDKLDAKVDKAREEVNEKIDGVKEEVSLLRGDVKALEIEVSGVNKRVDNQEFLNRATTVALVSAFFITILKAVFPNFPGI